MDKYPVFRGADGGELTVTPDALYTAFSNLLPGPGGAVVRLGGGGEQENLRIGVLERRMAVCKSAAGFPNG